MVPAPISHAVGLSMTVKTLTVHHSKPYRKTGRHWIQSWGLLKLTGPGSFLSSAAARRTPGSPLLYSRPVLGAVPVLGSAAPAQLELLVSEVKPRAGQMRTMESEVSARLEPLVFVHEAHADQLQKTLLAMLVLFGLPVRVAEARADQAKETVDRDLGNWEGMRNAVLEGRMPLPAPHFLSPVLSICFLWQPHWNFLQSELSTCVFASRPTVPRLCPWDLRTFVFAFGPRDLLLSL